ncbi:cyclin-D-binding Myb-like transcription factor 1 [Phodopus roborovskii]|uniref:Cyclin-D-binding Myb-like transcription factor 1 n=1 Tax=Phodopus roborovskii TaxID=109678 RepID=A0AAU9Z025_PHORO|nr:cyclin-D-binding Myb-like transcription factor 1 [Phodopus roborovskii]CAH6780428.1 4932411N23Rik [Phodopus roborovskii]
MSTFEEAPQPVTVEIVSSVLLTEDTDGNIILCLQNEADEMENSTEPPNKRPCLSSEGEETYFMPAIEFPLPEMEQGFELVTTTATEVADEEITEGTMMQLHILQDDNPEEGFPLANKEESIINKAWFTGKEDKENLSKQGHKWKQGMWSKEETDILMRNIERYMQEHGVENAAEIIFKMSKGKRKDFYRSISSGLNRPLFSVYRRVVRMYDDRNHVGKYTPEEIEKLKELWQQHGNDWIKIGAAMGRSPSSVKDRCRLMKDPCKTGKWTEEEEQILADVVHELTCTEMGEKVTQGVCWTAVAQRVGTRSAKQCRTKWLNYLNWKQTGGIAWTRKDEVTLIHRLAELDVSDENEIHWDDLAKGWESVRSPQWLRSKWWTIKRQITNHKDFAFPVLVQCLQQVYESQNASLMFWENKSESEASDSTHDISVQHVPIIVTSEEDNSTSICAVPVTGLQITLELVPGSTTDYHATIVNAETISLPSEPQ